MNAYLRLCMAHADGRDSSGSKRTPDDIHPNPFTTCRGGLSKDIKIYLSNFKSLGALDSQGVVIPAPDIACARPGKGVLKGLDHPFQIMNLKQVLVFDPKVFNCQADLRCPRCTVTKDNTQGGCCGGHSSELLPCCWGIIY